MIKCFLLNQIKFIEIKKILTALTINSLIFINGCAPYSNQFSCPAGRGINCKSVSYVNEQVDNGNLLRVSKKEDVKKIPTTLTRTPAISNISSADSSAALIRSPEKTLRIWLNGFMDGADCYREEQYVHKVIEKSRWEVANDASRS